MEQSKATSKQSSLLASATEDEIIVSQILLDLKSLVSLSESLANFNWGCRRRRSCLDENPPLRHESSCPPPLVPRTENEIKERRLQIKTLEVVEEEKGGASSSTTASPTTPLSFSPSESDERSKHSSKITSRKRSREDYIDIIQGLTKSRDVLIGEVENVKKFYNKLKAYNSELKAMKQEVINNFPKKEKPQVEISMEKNYDTDFNQNYRIHMGVHQQPYISDPTAPPQKFQYPNGPIETRCCSSNNGATRADNLGPLGIDLNLPAAEALGEPLDTSKAIADKRARFAEARRKRRGLMKGKSSRSAVVKYCQKIVNYENSSL